MRMSSDVAKLGSQLCVLARNACVLRGIYGETGLDFGSPESLRLRARRRAQSAGRMQRSITPSLKTGFLQRLIAKL